jgi:hypothetical protein
MLANAMVKSKAPLTVSASAKMASKPAAVLNRGLSTSSANSNLPSSGSHKVLAQTAVGRGIRHSFVASALPGASQQASSSASLLLPAKRDPDGEVKYTQMSALEQQLQDITSAHMSEETLSQLAETYHSSLNDLEDQVFAMEAEPTPLDQMQTSNDNSDGSGIYMGFLSRNSSLVDLAMIPGLDDNLPPAQESDGDNCGLTFIDFPSADMYPPGGSGESDANGPSR